MTTFSYIARDPAGQRVTGRLSGASEQVVLAELEARRLAPVKIEPLEERRHLKQRISVRHLAGAYRQIADLLRAGVPLLRALRLLGRSKSNPRLGRVFNTVADDVADGVRLGDALAAHGDIFPPVQIAMIRAGERGGFLEEVLTRMGTFLEHQADLRGRVVGNLIYPVVLLVLGLGIITFALVFFVPRFREFYGRIEIPLPTRILLATSDLLTGYWVLLVFILIGIVAGVWWLLGRADVRRRVTVIQLRIPKLGPLLCGIAVGRFCRVLGTMLANGIPLLAAMQISRDAAGNILLAEAIDDATDAVRAGETLVKPLADCGLFGEDVVEMIAVGESANNLPDVLVTIADTIEKRVDRMLTIFLRLMEPALLLCLAGVVLFIFIALIVPMMRMSSAI